MVCPKGHKSMAVYEDGALKKKYVCTTCDLKLELDTQTGKVVQVSTALAVVGAIVIGLSNFLGGGGGDNGA